MLTLIFAGSETQKPPQKPAPTAVSVAPAVKDPLVKKPETKLKPETTFQRLRDQKSRYSTFYFI